MAESAVLDPIPAEHREAVRHVLDAGVDARVERLEPVTGGASGALTFRATAGPSAYLVRIETARDYFRNPQRIYPMMLAAAEAGIAPPVVIADADRGVAVMAFIETKPLDDFDGGVDELIKALGELIARLQATAPFAPAMRDFGELAARMLDVVTSAGVFAPDALRPHQEMLDRIRSEYPFDRFAPVSAHNDVNPFNVLYDGERLWLVDWELAFGNDALADLAIVANNWADTPARVDALLQAWRGGEPTEADRVRLKVMRQLSQLFYGCLVASAFVGVRSGEATDALTPDEFRAAVAAGTLRAGDQESMFELGKMNFRAFLDGCAYAEFEDALRQAQRLPG